MSGEIYTVGNGNRTQLAQREDGVWFMRRKWHAVWGTWEETGKRCPYPFGKYLAPRAGKARLPNVPI